MIQLFLYSPNEHKVYDLTSKNRQNVEDAKDPGGRLGPQCEKGAPDLRNLSFSATEVNEGDIILAVSDGVHDNLDPITIGMVPKDLGLVGDTFLSWKSIPKSDGAEIRTTHMCKTLCGIIEKLQTKSPILIAKAVVSYCQEVTEKSREWMEQNPDSTLGSQSYHEFPGKMDHCTCLAVRVGSPPTGDYEKTSLHSEVFPY